MGVIGLLLHQEMEESRVESKEAAAAMIQAEEENRKEEVEGFDLKQRFTTEWG